MTCDHPGCDAPSAFHTHDDAQPNPFRHALDSLTDALERAEQAIRSMKFGVEVSVAIGDGDWELEWGYNNAPDRKKVARTLHARNQGGTNVVTFSGMNLRRRRMCAAAVPALVDALKQKRTDYGAEIQKAADDLDDYLCEALDDFEDGSLHAD